MPLLVPGIGAQGGDLNAVLDNGLIVKKRATHFELGEIIYANRAISLRCLSCC